MDIQLNLSQAFRNKENLTRHQGAFGTSFQSTTVKLLELAVHIADGKAFTLHRFKRNRRIGAEWLSSQLLALDLDDCTMAAADIAALPDVQNHAWLVYPSPSSTPEKPKTRILFVLAEAITDPARWQVLQLALMAHFEALRPDKACKDLARLFYGSTKPGHILIGKIASWDWISGLAAPLAAADYEKTLIRQRENRQVVTSGTRAEKYARAAFDKAIAELASAGGGTRNATLFKVAVQLYSMALGGWPGIDAATVRNAIESVYAGWDNVAKSQKTMERGFKAATAKTLELPEQQPANKTQRETLVLGQPAHLAPFTADRKFNSRFANQAPPDVLYGDCIALKSPTGSGKSLWAAEATIGAPSLLTVAFRRSLVKSQAKQYEALVYDDLAGDDAYLVSSSSRVSTTIDSLHKFSNRVFDTIVIDEWVSLIGHFSSAGTLKERAASTWELLKRLITSARRVIVMDAHLTNDSLAELQALRDDLVKIENTFVQPKASTQLLPNRLAFFSMAITRIREATAPVLLGVTSPAEARLTKDLVQDCYPGKRVRIVTVKQSHLTETQTFIRDINSQLPKIDVLIFNGAMSTGVDIQADVDSIICLINRPLSPADGVQMLGRARHAQNRFACVPDGIQGLDCEASAIQQNLELAATLTGVEVSRPVKSHARVHSRHEARRNGEMVDYLGYFRAYCRADGSDTAAATVWFDKALAEKIRVISKGHTEQRKKDVLDIDRVKTITPEMLEAIRNAGVMEITPQIDAGALRYKIEITTGRPITEVDYDRFKNKQARYAVVRLEAATGSQEREIDRLENESETPLHRRTNATAIKALFYAGIRQLGAKSLDELPSVISETTAETFAGFGQWAKQNIKRFQAVLGYRSGHDGSLDDDVKAVRFFLKRFGITLSKKQVMKNRERFMTYTVAADEIEMLRRILERRKAAAQEKLLSNGKNRVNKPFRSNRIQPIFTHPEHTPTDQRGKSEIISDLGFKVPA